MNSLEWLLKENNAFHEKGQTYTFKKTYVAQNTGSLQLIAFVNDPFNVNQMEIKKNNVSKNLTL